jgi:hypothetical protein
LPSCSDRAAPAVSILNRLDQRVEVAVMVRAAAEKERAFLDVE